MGTLALIGLGSNLGDRKAQLDGAVAALGEAPGCTLRAVSAYHEAEPVGGPGRQGAFLNAAAAVETTLDPFDLLRRLQGIETQAGRVRSVRWGERTLDLDLLLFGDRVIDSFPVVNRVCGGESALLQVPHPRMALRRFVLAPLAEIAPAEIDPLTGRPIADLLANLDRRPSLLTIHGGDGPFVDALFPRLVDELQAVGVTYKMQRELHRRLLASWEAYRTAGKDPGRGWIRANVSFREQLETWLEQHRRDLSTERRQVESECEPGRWRVSDFWIDTAYGMYGMVLPTAEEQARFLERLVAIRSEGIAPTFVVVSQGSRLALSRHRRSWPAPLGDVPLLGIDPKEPIEAITAEVLSACQATRAGC